MSEARTIQRYDYIDYLRAVGIILMVLAHIPLSDSFVHYVHGFHMPLFFVVSGFLFKGGGYSSFVENCKKAAHTILFICGSCVFAVVCRNPTAVTNGSTKAGNGCFLGEL